MPRFLQIHTLTSYPASLLNRDDAGMAKQMPFGGAVRTRISSQCLKRHWRSFRGPHDLAGVAGELGLAVRSRETFRRLVAKPLIDEQKLDAAQVEAVVAALMRTALGESAKAAKARKDRDDDADAADAEQDPAGDAQQDTGSAKAKAKAKPAKTEADPLHTGQVVVLGQPEIRYLKQVASAAVAAMKPAKDLPKEVERVLKEQLGKEGLANLKQTMNAGLDAAVFGRMVTSDQLARCDAAIHVAHAFTIHGAQNEPDYFSAIDDLTHDAGETGAGHINSTDLASGIYYSYVAIDLPLLRRNLGEQVDLAGRTVAALVHLISTVSPGAKLGSTAPHSFPHLVLAEAGDRQPCTLANAFLDPVNLRGDAIGSACARLAQEIEDLDGSFGSVPARQHLLRGNEERRAKFTRAPGQQQGVAIGERVDLDALAAWCAQQVSA